MTNKEKEREIEECSWIRKICRKTLVTMTQRKEIPHWSEAILDPSFSSMQTQEGSLPPGSWASQNILSITPEPWAGLLQKGGSWQLSLWTLGSWSLTRDFRGLLLSWRLMSWSHSLCSLIVGRFQLASCVAIGNCLSLSCFASQIGTVTPALQGYYED